MLTDIFARRYANVPMWPVYTEESRRLMGQTFQLLEDLVPYYGADGKPIEASKPFWTVLHKLLARELGVKELSPFTWGYWVGEPKVWWSGTNEVVKVCETWALTPPVVGTDIDKFVKERLSLVELGFRMRGNTVAQANAELPQNIAEAERFAASRPFRKAGIVLPGSPADGVKAFNATMNGNFQASINELNTRFIQAGCKLNYHNGFIQISGDSLVGAKIEKPFWGLVADTKWKNVDQDMKEAMDLRDGGVGDPAFYAARALESTIKIISGDKALTTGNEKGAHNYIDNLRGAKFIEVWETDALKAFFTKIRNPLGHGAGSAEIPNLDKYQTDWAIENCMSWTKSLIGRLQ